MDVILGMLWLLPEIRPGPLLILMLLKNLCIRHKWGGPWLSGRRGTAEVRMDTCPQINAGTRWCISADVRLLLVVLEMLRYSGHIWTGSFISEAWGRSHQFIETASVLPLGMWTECGQIQALACIGLHSPTSTLNWLSKPNHASSILGAGIKLD